MQYAGERAHRIPISSDHTVASSSKKYTALPQYRYAIRVAVILIALVGDILLISAAALTAAFMRFQSVSQTSHNDLLLVIVPAFLLAAVALDCYRLNTLRRSFRSIGRTLLALAIAAGLAFTTAFALQVGATYSRLETGLMLVAAAVYLPMGHLLYKAILDRLSGMIDPRVLILGPAFVTTEIAAKVNRSIPSERPNPADPGSLERTYAHIRHADRIILAFDDPAETHGMGSIRSNDRYRCRTHRTGLAEHYGSRSEPLGRNSDIRAVSGRRQRNWRDPAGGRPVRVRP